MKEIQSTDCYKAQFIHFLPLKINLIRRILPVCLGVNLFSVINFKKFSFRNNLSKYQIFFTFLIHLLLFSAGGAFSADHLSEEGYLLFLKNGRTIEADWYEVSGNRVRYEKFGVEISLGKKTISKIEKKTILKKDPDVEVVEYQASLNIPVYYLLSGHKSKKNNYNGLYEQNSENDGFPMYKSLSGSKTIFFIIKNHKKQSGYWAIGSKGTHYSQYSYIFEDADITTGHPVFKGSWKSSGSKIFLPEIKVVRANPPGSIYQGRFKLTVKGFPNSDCNGLYKPFGIYKGKVTYKSRTGDCILRPLWKETWVIEYKKRTAYVGHSKSVMYPLPHETTHWEDINKRSIKGTIEKFTPATKGKL